MKCPYCRWTGPFKSFGRHQWKKHKARVQRNLAKARRASKRSRKSGKSRSPSAASRKARSSQGDAWVRKGKGRYTIPGSGVTIIIGRR